MFPFKQGRVHIQGCGTLAPGGGADAVHVPPPAGWRYNPRVLPDLQLNDRLRLRKPHPCGSFEWTVVRLGADIGLECAGCGRRVLLTRRELAHRLKTNLTPHPDNPDANRE